MGWLAKSLEVVVAFMLIGVGLWQLALVIFAILLVPVVFRNLKGRPSQRGPGTQGGKLPLRYIAAGLLFVLAFFGYMSHGPYSPFVFGSLGLIVMFWGRLPTSSLGSWLKPVEESILLRSTPLPVSWVAVAQVKPLTRDLGRALAGVAGTVLVSTSEAPSIYVVIEKRAASEKSAEEAILKDLKEVALSLSALGAYLLPLDSLQSVALIQPSLEASKVSESDWSNYVATGTYNLISVSQRNGFAKSLGAHRKVGAGQEGRGRAPSSSLEFVHPPFLSEVFKAIGSRLTWPNPDQYTAFLSSLLATSGEPIGARVLDAGTASQSQMVLVRSQGSPSVELSRAQLRAVVRMYDKGTR